MEGQGVFRVFRLRDRQRDLFGEHGAESVRLKNLCTLG
jgi:hypothetical protein